MVSGLLELELQIIVSHYLGVGTRAWVFCESSQHSLASVVEFYHVNITWLQVGFLIAFSDIFFIITTFGGPSGWLLDLSDFTMAGQNMVVHEGARLPISWLHQLFSWGGFGCIVKSLTQTR